jgi:choline dehydrogenase
LAAAAPWQIGPRTAVPDDAARADGYGAEPARRVREDSPNLPYANVQPLSLDAFGSALHTFAAFMASVFNRKPASRDTVQVTSPDPSAAPKISPNYLSADIDRKVAADSIRLTRRIVSQPAMHRYAPAEFLPGTSYETDEELPAAAGAVGTCKMGPTTDPRAVVGPDLRVHGIERLRVVDFAIMPTITSGNTCSPTMMIARSRPSR